MLPPEQSLPRGRGIEPRLSERRLRELSTASLIAKILHSYAHDQRHLVNRIESEFIHLFEQLERNGVAQYDEVKRHLSHELESLRNSAEYLDRVSRLNFVSAEPLPLHEVAQRTFRIFKNAIGHMDVPISAEIDNEAGQRKVPWPQFQMILLSVLLNLLEDIKQAKSETRIRVLGKCTKQGVEVTVESNAPFGHWSLQRVWAQRPNQNDVGVELAFLLAKSFGGKLELSAMEPVKVILFVPDSFQVS